MRKSLFAAVVNQAYPTRHSFNHGFGSSLTKLVIKGLAGYLRKDQQIRCTPSLVVYVNESRSLEVSESRNLGTLR